MVRSTCSLWGGVYGTGTLASNAASSVDVSGMVGPSFIDIADDLNGDGYGDILISDQYASNGGTYNGTIYLAYGASPLSSVTSVAPDTIVGEADYTSVGYAQDADIDGDGFGDILSSQTQGWLVYGPVSGTVYTFGADAHWTDGNGHSLHPAGDPFGAGQSSLAFTNSGDSTYVSGGGALFVY